MKMKKITLLIILIVALTLSSFGSVFAAPAMAIKLVGDLVAGTPGTIQATVANTPVADADIYIEDELVGRTDSDGKLTSDKLTRWAGNFNFTAKSYGELVTKQLHVYMGNEPINISLTLGSPADTSAALTFHTKPGISPRVRLTDMADADIGYANIDDDTPKKLNLRFRALITDTNIITEPAEIHRYRFTGLKPDTRYKYFLDDKEVGSFLTAPGEQNRAKLINIALIPDTQQSDYQLYRDFFAKVAKSKAMNDCDLAVNLGDLVNAGWSAKEWNWWFLTSSPYSKRMPVMPVLGNHENYDLNSTKMSTPSFKFMDNYFTVPKPDGIAAGNYSFDYGNIHFAVVNPFSVSPNDLKRWLNEDLSKVDSGYFRVILMHQTPVSHQYDEKELRSWLMPLCEANNVDLLVGGHSHGYMRATLKYSAATTANQNTVKAENSVTYVIAGTACDKAYPGKFSITNATKFMQGEDSSKDSFYKIPNFVKLTSNGTSMSIAMTLADGTILDTAEFNKDVELPPYLGATEEAPEIVLTPEPDPTPEVVEPIPTPELTPKPTTINLPPPEETKQSDTSWIIWVGVGIIAAGAAVIIVTMINKKKRRMRMRRRRRY